MAPVAQDGEITLGQLQFLETIDGEVRVAGCISNGRDDTLADDRRGSVSIRYSGEPGDDYGGIMHWGGSGRLNLPEPLSPGHVGMFVSDFEVDERIARVGIQMTKRVDHDSYSEYVPTGPEFTVER